MTGIPCNQFEHSPALLLTHLKQGDAKAFEFIVHKYGGYLRNVALRYLSNIADAEDAVQETYIQALKNISTFRGDSNLKSWLHRIVVNNALMKIRKNSQTQNIHSDDNSHLFDDNGKRRENKDSIDVSIEEVHTNHELKQTIQRVILSLPEAYRNIMLLRDIENYSITETAEALKISPSSVKTGLHRARNMLRVKLEKLGYNDE